jgi:osmotically-inducible protein OsmY
VVDVLLWDPTVTSDGISVTTREGVVTLSGSVPRFAEKWAAASAARGVRGIKAIAEELDVNRFEMHSPLEAILAGLVGHALARRFWIPSTVQATIEYGKVTLSGQVRWEFQRKSAQAAVRHQPGVGSVTSVIRLMPGRQLRWISLRGALQRLLARALGREDESIDEFRGVPLDQQVTLAGYAQSSRERDELGWAPFHGRERRLKRPDRRQVQRSRARPVTGFDARDTSAMSKS